MNESCLEERIRVSSSRASESLVCAIASDTTPVRAPNLVSLLLDPNDQPECLECHSGRGMPYASAPPAPPIVRQERPTHLFKLNTNKHAYRLSATCCHRIGFEKSNLETCLIL